MKIGAVNLFHFLLFFAVVMILLRNLFYAKKLKKIETQEKISQQKIKKQAQEIEKLNASIKSKLKKARKIHRRLLPEKLIEPEKYFINDYYRPAEYIGGDYYNIFKIDHEALDSFFEQYLLYFFDVSGHGIDSTLLSIFINESIENYFKLKHSSGEMISTQELMNYVDQCYQKENFPDDYLVCLFISVLDLKKETLKYSSGGFQFPIFKFDKNNNFEELEIGGLPISSALGALTDLRAEKVLTLDQNTTLMLTTDGLLEQSHGEEIYFERLKNLLKNNTQLPSVFLKDLICKDFYNFTHNQEAEDDITFLFLERSDLEVFDFEQKNLKEEKRVFKNYIKKISLPNNNLLQKIIEITDQLLQTSKGKLKLKLGETEDYFIFSFEKDKFDKKWHNYFQKDYSEIISIKDIKDSENLAAEKNKLSTDNIYYSLNYSKNRLYFMLLKDDIFLELEN